jgi:hypothetical protein
LSAFLLNFPEVPSVEVCAFPFAWLCPIHAWVDDCTRHESIKRSHYTLRKLCNYRLSVLK